MADRHSARPDKGGGSFQDLMKRLGDIVKEAGRDVLSPEGLFFRGVQRGDTVLVAKMIKEGLVSARAYNAVGDTAMHVAARAGQIEMLDLLLAEGADIWQPSRDSTKQGATPVDDAVAFGQAAVLRHLLERANGSELQVELLRLLFRAIDRGQDEMVSILIESGVDLCATLPGKAATVLFQAMNRRNDRLVLRLLDDPMVQRMVNLRLPEDDGDRTYFHHALNRCGLEVIGKMLSCGALPNRGYGAGQTPLLQAIDNRAPGLVSLLLSYGAAAAGGQDAEGPTPLAVAVQMETMEPAVRLAIVEDLLAHGADPAAIDPCYGATALHLFLESARGGAGVLQALLASGPPLEIYDTAGDTPLLLAIRHASAWDVAQLLTAGADPNARHSETARTPLIEAALCGDADKVEVLLAGGANPKLLDGDGRSALSYARRHLTGHRCVFLMEEALRRAQKPLFRRPPEPRRTKGYKP